MSGKRRKNQYEQMEKDRKKKEEKEKKLKDQKSAASVKQSAEKNVKMDTFDPRTIGTPVYEALHNLRSPYDKELQKAIDSKNKEEENLYYGHLKEHKAQAVELYTYISTWGLMRLKAEEMALDKSDRREESPNKSNRREELLNKSEEKPEDLSQKLKKIAEKSQSGKREVILKYFKCLEELSGMKKDEEGAEEGIASKNGLNFLKELETDLYLGLTGLGLAIAQEFSFWATAVYHDISGEN